MKKNSTIILVLMSIMVYGQSISTFAGSGIKGSQNGPAADAQFNSVNQMVIDKDGNIYVTDAANHKIRKISPDGIVSTFAGSGQLGSANGPADQAQFNKPIGVAVDDFGFVYVAEDHTHKIRVIDPDGFVYDYAGTTAAGYADGPIEQAMFDNMTYMCFDNLGRLYIADSGNNRIRMIDPVTEMVTTLAGSGEIGLLDGPAHIARFNRPQGIAVDNEYNVYVGDRDNNSIRKIDATGKVTTIAGNIIGGHIDGNGTAARFMGPKGLAVDEDGNLYVADRLNYVIRKIDTNNNVTTVAGIPGVSGYSDGDLDIGLIGRAVDVVFLHEDCLLISDWQNDVIRKVDFSVQTASSELEQIFDYSLYPNPSTNVVNIVASCESNLRVILFNIEGKRIASWENEMAIDISELDKGFYHIHLYCENMYGVQKFFKN